MPTFLGLSAITLWGGLALLGSLTTRVPAFQLLFICFSISATLMFLNRILQKRPVLKGPDMTVNQWLTGISGLFGFHFCYFMALKFAPAMQVSLIVYLWPLLLTVLVATPGQRKRALLGGMTGFIGVSLVITQNQTGAAASVISPQYLTGYALAICCALIWSFYSWSLAKNGGSADDIGWLSLAVAALSLTAHLLLEKTYLPFTQTEVLGALLLGLGPVGGAFYLWDAGMKHGNRSLLAISSFAAPLITAFSLIIAGISDWSLILLTALVLVISGGLIANPPKAKLRSTNEVSSESELSQS